jgi:putative transposase
MSRKRHSDEQIVKILHQIERSGVTREDACRQAGIGLNTYYRWKKKFQGMQVQEGRRLRELERENARLKKLLAERSLEVDVLKEVIEKKW